MNDFLRNEVKYLKVYQNVQYKEIVELLEIQNASFYNWLKGYYNLGVEKQRRLKEIIVDLKEG